MELMPGEYLLIYSDGLSEARNVNDIFFGDDRIMKITQEWELQTTIEAGQTLLDAANKFARNAPQTDDMSMIILKRK